VRAASEPKTVRPTMVTQSRFVTRILSAIEARRSARRQAALAAGLHRPTASGPAPVLGYTNEYMAKILWRDSAKMALESMHAQQSLAKGRLP
jgi:hypothetical protein